jgi:ankyrin repeat protein
VDTPWGDAIKQGDIDTVRQLLHGGADIDARDPYGQTGLMLAAHADRAQLHSRESKISRFAPEKGG